LRNADNFLGLFYPQEFDYATINPLVHFVGCGRGFKDSKKRKGWGREVRAGKQSFMCLFGIWAALAHVKLACENICQRFEQNYAQCLPKHKHTREHGKLCRILIWNFRRVRCVCVYEPECGYEAAPTCACVRARDG